MTTVAVIGGGIAGLSAGEALMRQLPGATIRVLEAEATPGGKIATRRRDGFVVETGPHGFLDKEPAMQSLVQRLGLTEALVPADESSAIRYVFRQGKLRALPSSPPAFLTSDVLPFTARMRVLEEPFIGTTSEGDESVWQFAARRLGEGAADVLIDAFVTGIYGGDPKQLSLRAAFPRLAQLEAEYGSLIKAQRALAREKKARGEAASKGAGPGGTLYSFAEGLSVVIDGLAKVVNPTCNYRVDAISRGDDGFEIRGTGDPIRADAVVITAPAFVAADLTRGLAPEAAATLTEIPYVPVSVVVQGFEASAIRHDMKGFGFLVPGPERREILGSIWASSVFVEHAPDGTVMLRTLMGGARRPELAEGDDETLCARARQELVTLMGIAPEAKPILQEVIRWDRAIPQYTIGHHARVRAADDIEAQAPGLFLGGNALRGVAMIQTVKDAERIAEQVEAFISGRG